MTSQKCHKCGSFLILVDRKTETVEGQYSPVTTSTYQCSDTKCKEESEREMARIMKRKQEQELAKNRRIENIRRNRVRSTTKS